MSIDLETLQCRYARSGKKRSRSSPKTPKTKTPSVGKSRRSQTIVTHNNVRNKRGKEQTKSTVPNTKEYGFEVQNFVSRVTTNPISDLDAVSDQCFASYDKRNCPWATTSISCYRFADSDSSQSQQKTPPLDTGPGKAVVRNVNVSASMSANGQIGLTGGKNASDALTAMYLLAFNIWRSRGELMEIHNFGAANIAGSGSIGVPIHMDSLYKHLEPLVEWERQLKEHKPLFPGFSYQPNADSKITIIVSRGGNYNIVGIRSDEEVDRVKRIIEPQFVAIAKQYQNHSSNAAALTSLEMLTSLPLNASIEEQSKYVSDNERL